MKVQLLPSTVGVAAEHQLLSSYLIDETLCLDVGSLGFHSNLDLQLGVKHLFITHCHSDHLASLPIFLDAHFGEGADEPVPVVIHAEESTARAIREDVLNDRHWPDFFRINDEQGMGLLEMHILEEEKPVSVGDYRITPVRVDHIVDTLAFIVEKDGAAFALVTDTGPSDRIWEVCEKIPGLSLVILELSFPDRMQWLAEISKHLTTSDFVQERSKLPQADDCRFLAVHLKPNQFAEIKSQLESHQLPGVDVMVPGHNYEV
ncbi:MAG: MBL fold metallo-hydrolase [Planctomycetota bacterium]